MEKLNSKEAAMVKHRIGKLLEPEEALPTFAPSFTYEELYHLLANMTPEQRAQQVQIIRDNPTGAKSALHAVIGFNTIKQYCHDEKTGKCVEQTRGVLDNAHHPQQFVLLSDGNPFSEKGDTMYTVQEDGTLLGNVSGTVRKFPGRA